MNVPGAMVEYNCPGCNMDFCVIHEGDIRNKYCFYCNSEVTLTGTLWKVENDELVTYKDGVVIKKEPRKKMPSELPCRPDGGRDGSGMLM